MYICKYVGAHAMGRMGAEDNCGDQFSFHHKVQRLNSGS